MLFFYKPLILFIFMLANELDCVGIFRYASSMMIHLSLGGQPNILEENSP